MTNPGNQDRQTDQDQLGPPRNQMVRLPNPFQHQESSPSTVPPVVEPIGGTTRATAARAEDLQRNLFTTPHATILEADLSDDPDAPPRNRGPVPVVGRANIGSRTEEPALEGVASEVVPTQFVSQNYDNLVTLM